MRARVGSAAQLRLHYVEVAKRPDKNDATMDVSTSQLVGNRPPVPRQPGVSNNDASMWIGNVVSTDDFAPTNVRRPAARKGRGKLIVGLLAATAVAGVGGYAAYTMASGGFSRSSAPSASNTPTPPTAAKPQAAAPEPAPSDDAAVAEKPAVADAGPLVADAVSGADPAAKKTTPTKRTAIKKKVAKKKVATTTKKKRRRR